VVAACLASAVAGGFLVGRSSSERPAAAWSAMHAPAPTVRPLDQSPQLGHEPSLAVVVADEDTLIVAKHEARLLRLGVKPGDRVRAGQPVAEMDRRGLQAGVRAQAAKHRAAQAQVQRARTDLRAAKAVLRRANKLAEVTSAAERERARFERDTAASALREKTSESQALAAELELMRLGLEDAELAAPHDGVVTSTYVRPGQWLNRGVSLLRVVGRGRRVRFAIPAEPRATVAVGEHMEFVPRDGEPPLAITVAQIARDVDAASGMVFVEARFASDSGALEDLRPGAQGFVRGLPATETRPTR
jgi:RND family efflux transporter MFP subunit